MTDTTDKPGIGLIERVVGLIWGISTAIMTLTLVYVGWLIFIGNPPTRATWADDIEVCRDWVIGLTCCAAGIAHVLTRSDAAACKWLARVGAVLTAAIAIRFWRFASPVELAWMAGIVVALLVAQHIAHRLDLGWEIDPVTGERQKVEFILRGEKFAKTTTRARRMVEEVVLRRERRLQLLWSTPVGWGLAYAAWWLYAPAGWGWAAGIGACAAFFLLLVWLPATVIELLYLVGWQDMKGHRVTSPPPVRPGIADVAEQKAHGDARFATQAEAAKLLGGRR